MIPRGFWLSGCTVLIQLTSWLSTAIAVQTPEETAFHILLHGHLLTLQALTCLPKLYPWMAIYTSFRLVGSLLRFLLDQRKHISFTIIVFDLLPRKYWWALLHSLAVDRYRVGLQGCSNTLLFPIRNLLGFHPKPLQWDLWAFRCCLFGH